MSAGGGNGNPAHRFANYTRPAAASVHACMHARNEDILARS